MNLVNYGEGNYAEIILQAMLLKCCQIFKNSSCFKENKFSHLSLRGGGLVIWWKCWLSYSNSVNGEIFLTSTLMTIKYSRGGRLQQTANDFPRNSAQKGISKLPKMFGIIISENMLLRHSRGHHLVENG